MVLCMRETDTVHCPNCKRVSAILAEDRSVWVCDFCGWIPGRKEEEEKIMSWREYVDSIG